MDSSHYACLSQNYKETVDFVFFKQAGSHILYI